MKIFCADIGGTFVKYGLYDGENIIRQGRFSTRPYADSERFLLHLESLIEKLSRGQHLDGIALASAGVIDRRLGQVIYANNLSFLNQVPLREQLETRFNCPVYLENDCNAAAFGELKRGCGQHMSQRSFLCLTFGTGVGGSFIQNGHIYHGPSGQSCEFGRMLIWTQTRHGMRLKSFEQLASSRALVKSCAKSAKRPYTLREVMARYEEDLISKAIDQWCQYVAMAISNLTAAFSCQHVVLGGGVFTYHQILIPMIQKHLSLMTDQRSPEIHLYPAQLGNDAGLVGVSYMLAGRLIRSKKKR